MSKSAPDDLPDSYLDADPNDGYDPYSDPPSAGDDRNDDGMDPYGRVLFHRYDVKAALRRLRYDDGRHYIKTHHLADVLDLDPERCKHMMRHIEARGWISEWGSTTGITWYIEPLDADADDADVDDTNRDP